MHILPSPAIWAVLQASHPCMAYSCSPPDWFPRGFFCLAADPVSLLSGARCRQLKCLVAGGSCPRGTLAVAPVDENKLPLACPNLTCVFNFPERHKSRKQEEEPHEEAAVMNSQAQGQHRKPCNCKASSSSLIGGSGAGWEGTALLHHGSYIKLGCLQFVFSITEFATKQPKGDTALVQDMDLEEKLSLKPHQVPVLRSNSVP